MSVYDYKNTPGNNATLPGMNWAEGMPPRAINDDARQLIADIASWRDQMFLDPRSFGVIGDGATDDTTAMLALATYVNALPSGAVILIGDVKIKITANVTFTKSVFFKGNMRAISQIHCYASAQLIFLGTRSNPFNTEFGFQDIAVMTNGIHATSPIKIQYVTGPSLTPTVTFNRVLIRGINVGSGFFKGVEMIDTPFPIFNDVDIIGDEGTAPFVSTYGIYYVGGDGSGRFHAVRCYAVEEGIHIEGSMEGITMDELEMVVVMKGVVYKDTTGGLQPWFVITRSHINAEKTCVELLGIDQFSITGGCSFYGQPARAAGTAVWNAVFITPTTSVSAIVANGRVTDCSMIGDGAYAASKIGVNISGVTAPYEDYQIDCNRFQGLDRGVNLSAGTNGVRVGSNNTYRNVVITIDNQGNNVCLRPYRYLFSKLPSDVNLEGVSLFVLDSNTSAFYAALTGGGTIGVPVFWDATNWRVG